MRIHNIIIFSLMFLFPACSHIGKKPLVYIKGESHGQGVNNYGFKNATKVRARMGEVHLFLESYFYDENINKNIYGIESYDIYILTHAISNYSRLKYLKNNLDKLRIDKSTQQYYEITLKGSFFYDDFKAFKEFLKEHSLKKPENVTSREITIANYISFYEKVINIKKEEFHKYKPYIEAYLNFPENKLVIETLWDKLINLKRNEYMAKNIYNRVLTLDHKKDAIVIVGKNHVEDLINRLKEKGLDVKELKIKRRKKDRW